MTKASFLSVVVRAFRSGLRREGGVERLPADFNEGLYLAANPDVAQAVNRGEIESGRAHYAAHGYAERRPLQPGPRAALGRKEKALALLPRTGRGLEIGPSHNPLAPKREGFNVEILDHLDAAGLRHKYAAHGVALENIEEVDYVWHGEPLTELIGETSAYDWILASHVIEHVPDLVTFLQQCEKLLVPGGRISLVIPDKRYCFDHFNRASSTGDVLQAFSEKRKRPGPGAVFDHFANAARRDGSIAWSAASRGKIELVHSFEEARAAWSEAVRGTRYLDVHCWRFTPPSFRIIVSDLIRLGLLESGIEREFDTTGCEFFVTLRKGLPPAVDIDRIESLSAQAALD